MFFVASKLFWMVAAPVTMLFGLAGVSVLLLLAGWWRAGRALAVASVATLAVLGVVPVGSLLLHPLENRFPPLSADQPAPTGFVVLGGSTDQELAEARGRVTIAGAGDRMTEAVVLARRYPHARIVFAGGSAAIAGSTGSEADDALRLWTDMGIERSRIVTEGRSRNTDENVRFAKPLVDPKPGETWLLVTSAAHMPRAVALFRANEWPVLPDPVDYQTRGTLRDLMPNFGLVQNWFYFDAAAREWIGLLVYRVTGRTRTILPAP